MSGRRASWRKPEPSAMRELGRLFGQGPRRRYGLRRDLLPSAEDYYRARLPDLRAPGATGWASARCPLHEDASASLSVNLEHGGWRCHAGCGSGDLISFERQLHGLTFREACESLRCWGPL